MPKKRRPGRPRRVGRPIITGRYARKDDYAIRQIKALIRKSEHAWAKKRPHTHHDRQDILKVCGKPCYLDAGLSGTNDYAVCPRCSKSMCNCFPDCDALLMVKRLANKNGLHDIEAIAHALAEDIGCDWITAIKYLLATKYHKTLELI